jgi:DNA-binding transcriptional regulator YiaG
MSALCPHCGQPMPLTSAERHSLMLCRRSARISVKVLAAQIGVSVQALWGWEAGVRSPRPDHLNAWRRAVEVMQ